MADVGEEEQPTATAPKKSSDRRYDHLLKQITVLLKAKPEAAAKVKDDEKSAKICTAFFEDPEEKAIFIFASAKDYFIASRTPPTTFKQKSMYAFKREDQVTNENVESCLCLAEFSTSPLEQILAVSQVEIQ
jgi:hypothetical protein